MPQHHILTVGISLLTNFARTKNMSIEDAAKHHKDIAKFLQTEPRKACAEINSLDSRTGFLKGIGKEAVARYFTVTGECAQAARLKLLPTAK